MMITILVASLNANMQLAQTLQSQLNEIGVKSELINLVDLNLPMYDSVKEQNDGIPTAIKTLITTLEQSNGYLVVSPEYNFSIPPVLSNTVAWLSRSGDDFRKLFALKTIQLATHSGSNGQDVMNAMRTQFTKLGAIVMPREIITTYEKALNPKSSLTILEHFVNQASKE